MKMFARFAALFVAALFAVLLASAAPAAADGLTTTSGSGQVSCPDTGSESVNENAGWKKVSILPVERWSAVPLHSRLPLNLDPSTWFPVMQQNTSAMTLGMGNSAWQVTANVTSEASRFCIGDQVGRWLDEATAAMGQALISSGVIAAVIVIAATVILWRARRFGNLGAGLLKLVVVAAVLGSLIAGASATTNSAFGKGSPGWWGQTVNDTVSAVASGPVAALNDKVLDIINDVSGSSSSSDLIDCANYTQVLEWTYKHSFTNPSMMAATTSADAMWQSSGMQTWEDLQFGSNKWASKVGCRLLEYTAGVPGDVQLRHSQKFVSGGSLVSAPIKGASANSLAFSAITNDEIDQAMIGWAACTVDKDGNIGIESEWKAIGVKSDDCTSFFTRSKSNFSGAGTLNFTDNTDENITKTASDPEIQDFVLHLHGNKTGDQTGVLMLYVLASWVCAAVFAVLAGAVYVAKLGLVALGLFAVWVLLAGLIKINDNGSKVAELGKHYVTMAFFAFGATALMTIVAMLTAVIHKIGTEVSGGNATSAAFWSGVAPVVAVVLLNLFFTKLLKAPSPFKPTSALAWGAAAGGTGLLAGAGMERMMNGRMRRAGNRLMNIGEKAVAGRLGKGGGRRKGGMSPLGEVAKTGAGMALGAGLAEHMHDHDQDRDEQKKSGKTNEFAQMQEAHDYFARGGREFTPTGNAFSDNLTEAGMRLDTKMDQFRQRIGQLGSSQGRRQLAGDMAAGVGGAFAGSHLGQQFSKNPLGTAAKMGVAGLAAGAGALVLGVPGAAIVGTGYAVHKARQARAARADFRHQHGGLTQHEVAQRQDELRRFQAIQQAQAEAAKAQAAAAQKAAADAAGAQVTFVEQMAASNWSTQQMPEVTDRPPLEQLRPRRKIPQPIN